MGHHEAPQGWPTIGEQPDGSVVYATPVQGGAPAGPMPELLTGSEQSVLVQSGTEFRHQVPFSHLTPQEIAEGCEDVRGNIENQLNALLGQDLSMHFTVRDILSGLLKIKGTQVDNG